MRMNPDKLVEFINRFDIECKENARSYILRCPSCRDYKLYIDKEDGHFICFKCADEGYKGPSPVNLFTELTGQTYSEVYSFFFGYRGDPFQEPEIHRKPQQDINNAFVNTKNHYKINLAASESGLKYLQSRGITKELALKLQIKYDPVHKQVIFPVYDMLDEGRLVGFQGRSINPNIPKQFSKFTMPGFKKAQYLMFEETINSNAVIMAEGPISALKFAESGIGYVATMGKAVSKAQFARLKLLGVDTVYLALDRDAYQEVHSIIKEYCDTINLYLLEIPSHRDDFGDCTFQECKESVLTAKKANLMTILPVLL